MKNMNFIEAVRAAKNGKKIKRAGWLPACELGIDDTGYVLVYAHRADEAKVFSAHICHILADDWVVVSEPQKTMTWTEALELLKNGKKVRRLSWGNPSYHLVEKMDHFLGCCDVDRNQNPYSFRRSDIEATDWVEFEEV